MSDTKLLLRVCASLLVTSGLFNLLAKFPEDRVGLAEHASEVRPDSVAASSSTRSPEKNPASFSELYPRYRLCKSDTFDVTLDSSSEFNQTVIVQPDGYITLNRTGSLHVE